MTTGNDKFKYTEDNPLRVFTAFSGYDSQCMALDRIGIPCTLVGWSEIDKNAIMAHNAVYPQYADRNYGDIQQIDWKQVPDFDLFTFSSPCQDFSAAGLQRGGARRFRYTFIPSLGMPQGHHRKEAEVSSSGEREGSCQQEVHRPFQQVAERT